MKKILFLIPIVGMLWSCSKQSQVKPGQSEASSTPNKLQTKSAVDHVWDVLGFGYDVTGEYGNSSATTFQVIDIAKLNAADASRVVTQLNTTRNAVFSYGENAQAYSSDLSAHLTATTGFSVFSGSITAAYSNSSSFSSKYIYGSYSLLMQQKELKFNATPALLQSYLMPSFVQDAATLTPQQLVAQYGAFVLSDIMLGAKLEITYQSETKASDRKSAASAGLDEKISLLFSLKTDINTNHAQSSSNYNQYLHYITHGGDPTKEIVGTVAFNQVVPVIDYSAWQASTNFQNAELIDIKKDGLIPIYALIADPAKSAAVKTYVDQYLKDHQVNIVAQPPSLPEGQFTRNDDTGQVYIVMDGELRYIPNQDVLNGLFEFNTSLMVHYSAATLSRYAMGDAISPDNGIINDTQTGRVYFREHSYIRYIPNQQVKALYHFNFKPLRNVNGISAYVVGPDM
ncbi:MAC/Perforin domain-containing protein [Mucilaginibacter lappiensis]|uniref:MACPF domain-containing protein n=1 Tax=Mucilaginibacter lappiensis TaxID=354630 RepID=A0ABR6PN81_9SPHI|nr:MAC/perforin domain-containing protein [Mucilaginibacter lappiensis]MBB6111232.1 hypothetical protein [Mucilaginibacter lappiensis]SIR73497.1 MAC/Perforin domain-containing protein [Mucilaginibacter lappiensis]